MKTRTLKLLGSIVAVALITYGCATASSAKIARADAERTALAKAPGGVIKEGELEKEKGKLIWSFDIAMPGSKDILEVHVDANTGEVIGTETESESHEKAEKSEKGEKKK